MQEFEILTRTRYNVRGKDIPYEPNRPYHIDSVPSLTLASIVHRVVRTFPEVDASNKVKEITVYVDFVEQVVPTNGRPAANLGSVDTGTPRQTPICF